MGSFLYCIYLRKKIGYDFLDTNFVHGIVVSFYECKMCTCVAMEGDICVHKSKTEDIKNIRVKLIRLSIRVSMETTVLLTTSVTLSALPFSSQE